MNAHPVPVVESDRIASLDVVRGFAVLGILILNIQSFAMIGAAYMNPTAYGDLGGANYQVWFFSHLLGDQKFMTIFSLLFGAGIVLMTSRAEAAGGSSAAVHYRRMGWLLLFGLMHAHLLWYGDILFFYALCGLVAWLFRRRSPWLLIVLGMVAFTMGSTNGILLSWSMPEQQLANMGASWAPTAAEMQPELDAYRGGWLAQMGQRVPTALFFELFLGPLMFCWKAGGLMLIGMALYKLGVFSAERSRGFYAAMLVIGAGIGLPLVGWGMHRNFAHEWSLEYSFRYGSQPNYWGSLLVAMAWVGAVMLACLTPALNLVTRPLAAVGRMALTNYLAQTIICTTIFYGHGFGLFGQVERTGQIGVVVAVWAVQLVWSPIWLSYFRYGPFEWLWRSLTYWKIQPLRRV